MWLWQEAEDKDLGVSDKFNLVLQVARKVQVGRWLTWVVLSGVSVYSI